MLYRYAIEGLTDWMKRSNRKPLVIRGARQVGKTYLVRQFCEIAGLDLIEINFEELTISEFEKEESFDIDRALTEIESIVGRKITDKSLLFLDEIQVSIKAYNRLRFFKEKKPELPVIAAGSLLEFELKKQKQGAPVGRIDFLFLGPLTFFEFLLVNNENILLDTLKSIDFAKKNPISLSVHNKLCDLLKDYFFVGGMPEAVSTYVANNRDIIEVSRIHESIVESYRQDLRKHTDGKISKVILEVFDSMAFEIGKKVKFSKFSKEKSNYVKESIEILQDIFLLQKVYHSNCAGIPLKKGEDSDVFKVYLLDVGIYNFFMGVSYHDIAKQSDSELLNKGDIAEQFCAVMKYLGEYQTFPPRLHYWLRDKNPNNAEIDFVAVQNQKIVPIEIKSGKTGSIKSLIQFMFEKRKLTQNAIRYDLAYREEFQENFSTNIESHQFEFNLTNIPLYLI